MVPNIIAYPDQVIDLTWDDAKYEKLRELEQLSQGDPLSLCDIEFVTLIILQARLSGASLTGTRILSILWLRVPPGGWTLNDHFNKHRRWVGIVQQALNQVDQL
ncbi:MAG TPA: hypothetical protein VFT87_01800 [Candidatus Saccharimonadales bacterium]|nr:hypothetical protein [Candidatus Saccharimonadales bacterium]